MGDSAAAIARGDRVASFTDSGRSAPTDWWGFGAVALTSTIAVLVATQHWGIGMGSDSVAYAAASERLRDGQGWAVLPTVWPPLYPGLLAAGRLVTGSEAMMVGRLLAAASAGALVVLAAVGAKQEISARRLRYVAVVLVAASPALLGQQTYFLTDAPFAVAFLGFLLLLARLIRSPSGPSLAACVAVLWIAFGFRYTGLYLIPMGALAIVAFATGSWGRRFGWAGGFAVAAGVLPAVWALRNRSVDGSLFGARVASAAGLKRNTVDTLASLGRAMVGHDGVPATIAAAMAVLMTLGAAVVAIVVWRRDRNGGAPQRANRSLAIFAIACAWQLLLTDVTSSMIAVDRIDLRFIAPVFAPTVLIIVGLLDRLGAPGQPQMLRIGVSLVAYGWMMLIVVLGVRTLVLISRDGGQFNGADYAAVRADPVLAAVPEGCHIFANVVAPLYWVGRDGENSPDRAGYQSRQASDDLQRFVARTRAEPVCLVWIPQAWTQQSVYRPEELAAFVQLHEVARSPLVAVYRVTPSTQ